MERDQGLDSSSESEEGEQGGDDGDRDYVPDEQEDAAPPPAKKRRSRGPELQCPFCPKQFVRDELARHESTHTGFKPFVCLTCEMGFTARSSYNYHVRNNKCPMDERVSLALLFVFLYFSDSFS
jgi:hypothetical protein